VRIEALPVASAAPGLGLSSSGSVTNPSKVTPGAIGGDLAFTTPDSLNGPASAYRVVWVDGKPHGTLTYFHAVSMDPQLHLLVETSPNLSDWSKASVAVLHEEVGDGRRRITVLDLVPLDLPGPRFLRVRTVTNFSAQAPN
ncbi:MAG: hypothetical protein KF791_20235, partial [Verrucomicrobiae bacterium]|nr:hypothetical protein [Verrucomicrobiae bacterium]